MMEFFMSVALLHCCIGACWSSPTYNISRYDTAN